MKKILEGFSLANRIAVITGTTRGLGQSLAEALADAGATVVAFDRSDTPHLAEYCAQRNVRFQRVVVDLESASSDELERHLDTVVREFGGLHVLVNNAGITRRGEVESFANDDWEDVLQLNLSVPFYLSRRAAKYFIPQKEGKIINVASLLSFQGGVRVPSYAASKHGIVGLTKSFANGLARYGINVNAIAPGFMLTDLTLPLHEDPEHNDFITKRIPAGRWGNGDDLKGVLIFLASALSNYLHGAVIPVDGGWLSR